MTVGREARPVAPSVEPLSSFAEIHVRYFEFVWASLRGLGVSEHGIEDATQDVFIILHRRLPDFEARSTLKTFLFGIVVGVARNYRRSAKHSARLTPLSDAPELADTRSSPFERTAASQAFSELVCVLDQMDDAKREVLVLSEWEEMSSPEIAEVLGIGLNTVYSRLRLARAEFERIRARGRRRSP